MFGNPIIQRYRFTQFRAQQLWVFGTLYVGILLLIFFINTSIYSVGEMFSSTHELYSALFVQFSVLQIFILWLVMPMNCSNVVPREIADKSFDFFRMLPLPSTDKAVGILVGRNLFCILIAAVNLCMWFLFGFLGDMSISLLIQCFLLLITASLVLNSSSLLFSILSFRNTKTTSVPILLLVGVFAIGPIMGAVANTVEEGQIEAILVSFLTVKIPILYLISAYLLIGAIWTFAGIKRRFSCEYEPLFSRKGALGFMACYLFLVYAIYHNYLFNIEGRAVESLYYSFYCVTAVPMIGISLLSIRTFDKYIEITRLSSKKDGLVGKIFLNSNLFLGVLVFLLWAAVAFVSGIVTNSLDDYCKLTVLLFTSWLIIISLVEMYAIYLPNNEKIAYLLGFIGGLYLVLPMIFAGTFGNDYLMMFSPIGVAVSYQDYNSFGAIIRPLLFNIILLAPLLLMIGKRYSTIAKLRSSINTSV